MNTLTIWLRYGSTGDLEVIYDIYPDPADPNAIEVTVDLDVYPDWYEGLIEGRYEGTTGVLLPVPPAE